jgi:4-amino-4-deoxy-L-arabinose transferase-like glycosyltransferase
MDLWWQAAVVALVMCVPWVIWRSWMAARRPAETTDGDVARAGRERVSTLTFEQATWLVAVCSIVVFMAPVSPLLACALVVVTRWWWRSTGAGSRP